MRKAVSERSATLRDMKMPESQTRSYAENNISIVPLFKDIVHSYYQKHARKFPWRETRSPYGILVSEFMLQQTQVERVLGKYPLFIASFPDFQTISCASLKDVLLHWQGLGYNRRAVNLWKTAQAVVEGFHGDLPETREELIRMPGIGRATAGAILAFAFNRPVVFIETNIRRAFIHHFFQDRKDVRDSEILPLVEATLDYENPRQWYYALMDYGERREMLGDDGRPTRQLHGAHDVVGGNGAHQPYAGEPDYDHSVLKVDLVVLMYEYLSFAHGVHWRSKEGQGLNT